jgi:group I intron endonuclease
MKTYLIYKHTNKINGKSYIGQTCQEPEKRWGKNGSGYKNKHKKFWRAIKKYGWDTFIHDIIYYGLTAEEANKLERQLIEEYDSIKNGYNISEGGSNNPRHVHAVYKLDKNKNILAAYDCIADAERALGRYKTAISSCCTGDLSTSCGYHWCYQEDYATYSIKSKSKSNRTVPSGNTVYQLDVNKNIIAEYPSYLAAQRSITGNINCRSNTAIKGCCLGKQSSYYGFYWCLATDYEKFQPRSEIKRHSQRAVEKLDPTTLEILATYSSVAEATASCGGAKGCASIILCCKGKQLTAYNYKWKYKEE